MNWRLLIFALLATGGSLRVEAQERWIIRTDDPKSVRTATDRAGLVFQYSYKIIPYSVYAAAPGKEAARDPQRAGAVLTLDGVAWEPDAALKLADWEQRIPNDTLFESQVQFSAPEEDADTHLREAWRLRTITEGIVIAVLDSGLQSTHEDLQPSLWINPGEGAGFQFTDDDNNGFIDDIHGWNTIGSRPGLPPGDFVENNDIEDNLGHGTAVSGIIGGVGDNGKGIAGVCWRATQMMVKWADIDNFGDPSGTTVDAIDAVEYALGFPQVKIMNISWGSTTQSGAVTAAMHAAEAQDVLVVAAAGNNGSDFAVQPFYPAANDLPNIISVASIANDGSLSSFSNYGAAVSVAAPGEALFSTKIGGGYGEAVGEGGLGGGTSFSAPVVSAAAALMYAQRPDMTAAQVKTAIIDSARRTPGLPAEKVRGGLLDVYKMLTDNNLNAAELLHWRSYR